MSYTRNFEQVKGIEPSSLAWKAKALTVVLHLQIKYAHLHRRAYLLLKRMTLADIVVGVVGFEPTKPEGNRFTVCSNSGALPSNNGINKTQTQSRYLNVSEYKDIPFFGLCKQIDVKICNN